MSLKPALYIASIMSIILTACGQSAMDEEAIAINEGAELVKANCLTCHSLSSKNPSPRTDAPSLDRVLANYNSDSLADDFREGVHVGHPDMPDFDFGDRGTDEVIAYLKSIEKPE